MNIGLSLGIHNSVTGGWVMPDWSTYASAVYMPEAADTATVTTDLSGTTAELIHTSPLFIPGGWGPDGHEYWCGVTPYPSFAAKRENPSLLSSADGTTWVEPTGLTNPIEGPPAGGSDYNADITLYYAAGTLHVYWTQVVVTGTHYYWRHASSTNGVDWDGTNGSTAPAEVKDGTFSVGNGGDAASPAVVKRVDAGAATTYGAWSVDVSAGPSGTYTCEFRASDSLTDWDQTPTSVTLGGKFPSTHRPWHVWVGVHAGKYTMIMNAQPKEEYDGDDMGSGQEVLLYIGTSTNPLSFDLYTLLGPNGDTSATADWMSSSVYRSGMYLAGPRAGELVISAYTGTTPGFTEVAISEITAIEPTLDWAVAPVGTLATTHATAIAVSGDDITGIDAWTGGTQDGEDALSGGGTLKLTASGIESKDRFIYWSGGAVPEQENVMFVVIWQNGEASCTDIQHLIRCGSIGMGVNQGLVQMNYWSGSAYTGVSASKIRHIQDEWRLGVYSYDGTHMHQWVGVKGDNPAYTRTTESKLGNLATNAFRTIGNTAWTGSTLPNDITVSFFGVEDAGHSAASCRGIWEHYEQFIPV